MRRAILVSSLWLASCHDIAGLDDYGFDECADSVCGLVSQCGCGQGEGCYYLGGGNECAPAGGRSEGQPCDRDDECEPGTSCLDLTDDARFCLRFCEERDDDCYSPVGRSRCALHASDNVDRWCSLGCDPLSDESEGCPAGYGCVVLFSDQDGRWATHCLRSGERQNGQTCGVHRDAGGNEVDDGKCARGLFCYAGTCAEYCTIDSSSCDGGVMCRDVLRGQNAEASERSPYGLCEVPAAVDS